jgi:hypothetical protein
MTTHAKPHYIAVWTHAGDTPGTIEIVAADSYSADLVLHNYNGAPDEVYFGYYTPAQLAPTDKLVLDEKTPLHSPSDISELKTIAHWHIRKDANDHWTAVGELKEAERCAEELNETR